MKVCNTEEPRLTKLQSEDVHTVACHLDQETKDREAAKLLAGMMAEAS